eukprot:GGOE01053319.1.p2 GENE.GGOE01053319.1~~GGOE01053319.1.p2  ORF type:complete len:348 (-),score=101.42 GGOE01053319.1:398-1441(-)
MSFPTVAVLGGGAFGTAFAQMLGRKGFAVRWWVRNERARRSINEERINPAHMSDVKLHERITAFGELSEAVQSVSLVMVGLPTPCLRQVFSQNRGSFPTSTPIVLLSKGIEMDTLLSPLEIVREELPGKYSRWVCCLSGPSFAREIIEGKPTTVTIASEDREIGNKVQGMLGDRFFRLYTTTDTIGVEYGGALKNIIAIASGMSDGLDMGCNGRAGIITRGLTEMSRITLAKGGNPMTMLGLAGVGDLLLTCTGTLSRNYTVGFRLGRGETMEEISASMSEVAEGVLTAKSVHSLAQELHIEVPICDLVYQVIWEGYDIRSAVESLVARPTGEENAEVCALISRSTA